MRRFFPLVTALVAVAGLAAALPAAALPAAAGAAGDGTPRHRAAPAVTPYPFGLLGTNDSQLRPHLLLLTGTAGGQLAAYEGQPTKFATYVAGTAITPRADSYLYATAGPEVVQFDGVFGHSVRRVIDLRQFSAVGQPGYTPYSDGISVAGHAALVSIDETGLVQLRQTGGRWRVDSRVHSNGRDSIGKRFPPGLIPLPGPGSAYYSGVATSDVPLPDGRYVGVTASQIDNQLRVVLGVGSPHPEALRVPTGDVQVNGDTFGRGDVAFDDRTAAYALVGAANGLVELDLTRPDRPQLQPLPGIEQDDYVTVALNRTGTLAAAADSNGRITVFHADDGVPTSEAATTSTGAQVTDVAFTSNDRLVATYNYGGSGYAAVAPDPAATADLTFEKPAGPFDEVAYPDTLSLWPSYTPAAVQPARILTGSRVGRRSSTRLSVSGGTGPWRITAVRGLPPGVTDHGALISGRPRRAGRFTVTVVARNLDQAPAVRTYRVRVRRR